MAGMLRQVSPDGFWGHGRSRLTCCYDHMATLAWASTLRRLSQGCCVGSRKVKFYSAPGFRSIIYRSTRFMFVLLSYGMCRTIPSWMDRILLLY
jgi:hypothetical protein